MINLFYVGNNVGRLIINEAALHSGEYSCGVSRHRVVRINSIDDASSVSQFPRPRIFRISLLAVMPRLKYMNIALAMHRGSNNL
jgi:hypothetical protein